MSAGLGIPEPGADGIRLCAACRRAGGCRLGLKSERLIAENRSLTELICPESFEGGIGVAHGGWTTEAFDEALGHINLLMGQMAVTGELTVRFLKPVPIERPLLLEAWCEKRENGRRWNRGELRLASTGALLGTAQGVFVERDPSHFDRFRDWLADQDGRPASDAT